MQRKRILVNKKMERNKRKQISKHKYKRANKEIKQPNRLLSDNVEIVTKTKRMSK